MNGTPKKRRKFNISLRFLLVAYPAIAVAMGWYVRSESQRKTVETILGSKGGVIYQYRYRNGKYAPNATPYGPPILLKWLGEDYFNRVRVVDFSRADIQEIPNLRNLPGLRSLWIRETNVDDLAPIEHIDLNGLWASQTDISSLEPLRNAKSLEWLNVAGTNVSDLSPLLRIESLQTLIIKDTKVSREQIEIFQKANPGCKVVQNAESQCDARVADDAAF